MTLEQMIKDAMRRGYRNYPLRPHAIAMVCAALMGRSIESLPVFRKEVGND